MILLSTIVKEEEVLAAEIDASLLDVAFSCEVLRNCVTQSQVLNTEIGHVDKILRLWIEVVATTTDVRYLSCATSTREHIRIVVVLINLPISDVAGSIYDVAVVVELVSVDTEVRLSLWQEERTC